jgi:hypothetical protein
MGTERFVYIARIMDMERGVSTGSLMGVDIGVYKASIMVWIDVCIASLLGMD